MRPDKKFTRKVLAACLLPGLFSTSQALGQAATGSANASQDTMVSAVHDLQEQVRDLRAIVDELRTEADQYRAQTAELQRELHANQPPAAANSGNEPTVEGRAQPADSPSEPLQKRVALLEDTSQLISGKIDEQYQTKIESASKYRVRLSGIVLLNLFSNRGASDNQDFPEYAVKNTSGYSDATLGATLRQSELGLEVFGPHLAGARTSGDLQMDFGGGFPQSLDGANFGLVRLRIASMRMDWQDTSLVAGQDSLFFSPLSPDSLASLAVPTLAYQGNLWGWTPQVRLEHRFEVSDSERFTLQAGILDNFTGEPPPIIQAERVAQAGEGSGQPAYAARGAWTRNVFGRPMTVGAAAYYSRQNWGFNRRADGWAGMSDWEVPLPGRFSFSGEFYRGRAIGGIGGGVGRSILFSGDPALPTTQIQTVGTIGGWSQLKFKATSKLEFNGAFGLDNPMAKDLLTFPVSQSYADPTLAQNRAGLVNFIFRPRSDLLLSTEYRHLRTFDTYQKSQTAEQMDLSMGILF